MYPLVCISFSRYSRIFSLSTPTPIERSPSILIPPPVLPSLASCDRFLGSCLLPVPLPRYSPSSPPPPSRPISLSLSLCPPPPLRSVPMPTPPLSSVQRRAHSYCYSYFFRVRMCADRESERAQPPTRRGASPDHAICARTRARARFFPRSSTVPVRCNGNYVKGVVAC